MPMKRARRSPAPQPPSAPVTLTVTHIGGLGDGIAQHEGKPVFIPKSCAGDIVSARIVQATTDNMRAQTLQLLTPGPERIQAPCPHYDACGGCSLQHVNPAAYSDFKYTRLRYAITQAGYPDTTPIDLLQLPHASRRRVDFRVIHQPAFAFAFHGFHSHRLTPIDNCIVLDNALQSSLARIRTALAADPSAEALRAVQLTLTDSGIDMVLECIRPIAPSAKLTEQAGVARVTALHEGHSFYNTSTPVDILLGGYSIPLPAQSFLQATQQGQQAITDDIAVALKGRARVADLFSGIGTYSFPLVAGGASVRAYESGTDMVDAMQSAIDMHGLTGSLRATRRDLFTAPLTAQELAAFDGIVINPPRAGAKAQCEVLAQSGVPVIVMVSCNPATFTRDAAILRQGGYRLEKARGIDQFVWSAHLEIVAIFRR